VGAALPPLTLSKRLAAIAEQIPDGAKVIDVGTDHGYIPTFLAQTGRATRIVASDKMPGPLAHARRTAAEHGVEDLIEFSLRNGLPPEREDIDTVVISGMGAETIIEILTPAEWLCEKVTLVLQPQTKRELLYSRLQLMNFTHIAEINCLDRGREYFIYVCR
jgi:tRNA (adenine22-N1)-methyltransferase